MQQLGPLYTKVKTNLELFEDRLVVYTFSDYIADF